MPAGRGDGRNDSVGVVYHRAHLGDRALEITHLGLGLGGRIVVLPGDGELEGRSELGIGVRESAQRLLGVAVRCGEIEFLGPHRRVLLDLERAYGAQELPVHRILPSGQRQSAAHCPNC